MSRVAVLGGGGVGACAALELADAGVKVDVFERNKRVVFGASRVNEGKIHQGFIYAKDDPERTALLMAIGALNFTECLRRWIDVSKAVRKSTPFTYAVHKDSMITLDEVRRHFDACCSVFGAMQVRTQLAYIDREEPIAYRELSRDEITGILESDHFLAAFETTEFSVDPRPIADALAKALQEKPGVTILAPVTVVDVARRTDGSFTITYEDGGQRSAGPYDHVINATWESRLAIDRSMGLEPPQMWSFRHKFGNRVNVRLAPSDLPSVTCILGPFGDIVNFGDNGFYLSWYPTGMVAMTGDIAPPIKWSSLDRRERLDIFYRSLEHWTRLCPKLRALNYDEDAIDPVSGIIFAWGDTDIDHVDSHLHTRFEVGVHSVGRYHTVNTGKFTLVPYTGLEVANRILNRPGSVI